MEHRAGKRARRGVSVTAAGMQRRHPGGLSRRKCISLNNNRNNNNNRRRGRGNRQPQQGGGNQNRIDSRARGNAPQMLDKYKKLAQDAQHNGDRVQAEYYLQFADHYFRVVADSRPPRDESRPQREHNRDQPFDDYEADDREQGAREEGARDEQPRGRDRYESDGGDNDEGRRGAEGEEADSGDNPFTREARGSDDRSGQRSRGRRPANDQANGAAPIAETDDESAGGIDPGLLPPSIARDDEEAAPRAARGRPRRSRRPEDDGDEEALEAIS
jgi:hypothetical protein